MDEAKEKGGSVATVADSSVTVSETVAETMVYEHQVHVEEEGEAGHSNGDDIMVEVLGSHVYVDGICTTDGGDGSAFGAGLNVEEVHARDESGEVGLVGNLRSLDSEGDTAGDLGSRSEVSGGQAAQNEVNGYGVKSSHAPGSSAGGEASVSAEPSSGTNEGPGDSNRALERQKVGDLGGDQLSHGNQNPVVFSTASDDSSVKTEVFEGAAMADGEDFKTQVTVEDVLHSDAKDSVHSRQSPELLVEGQLDEKVNSSMEIDKQGADSEQRQMEANTSCLSTENQATGNDQSLKSETVIDRGYDDLSKGELMDVERKVSDAENVCLSVEQDIEVQDEPVKEEAIGVGPENVDQISPSVASDKNAPSEKDACVGQDINVEEQITGEELNGLDQVQEMEVEEHDTDSIDIDEKSVKWTALKPVSSLKEYQAKYQIWSEQESEFSVSDLVWGKVRSHPWWPGQIFDPSDASEKAVQYHKKDSFLVAYFGDRTFSWNEASVLKPFRTHFSQIEKQSSSESFQNAVNCALEEVSRRVELGLACSCTSQDAYDKIKVQKVENVGVRPESSIRDGVDMSLSASSFEVDKLVDYMRALAESPSDGGDRLDLVIVKAQLFAFYRFNGCRQLPELQLCGGLKAIEANMSHSDEKMHCSEVIEHSSPMDTDGEQISTRLETSKTKRRSSLKRKHNLKDVLYPRKKERSLSELMVETCDSPDGENGFDGIANKITSPTSGKKRKAVGFVEDSGSLARVSPTTPNIPRPSFKIGECIRRAASQMTGSPSILKSCGDWLPKHGGGGENNAAEGYDIPVDTFEDAQQKMNITTDYLSMDEFLSELNLAACDPMKSYSSFNDIVTMILFFSDFRDSVVREQLPGDKAGGKRKKLSNSIMGSPETFEFEDMNDTYWTDKIVQNGSEEQPSPHGNGRGEYQIVPVDLGKHIPKARKSRKRYSDVNYDQIAQKPSGYVDEKAPAELVLYFSEINSVPSETKLNKMFKHFGPLREPETEVDRETSRARVVFRRTSDAEVAYNSAGKFNIFGAIVVNYQLNYSISESFKASLYAPTLVEETPLMDLAHLCGNHDHAVVSTLGQENSLIAPSFGEEASFIVSTLGDETLPIDATFHAIPSTLCDGTSVIATTMYTETIPISTTMYEETMSIPTTMYEEKMPIATSMFEETMSIATSMYEETMPIATTAGEGTMSVVTTIGDQTFMTTSTGCEQSSTIVTTVSEQTSTVDSTLVEEASLFTTTMSNETSNITNFGEETFSISSLGPETSTIPTNSGEETPSIPAKSGEETPSIPTNPVEESPSILTTLEIPADPVTLAEESSTQGKEIPNLRKTVGEETPVIPATFSEETLTNSPTFTKETPTVPVTLGDETTTIPATLGEENTNVPAISQEETLAEETPRITTTLGEETPVNTTSSGEEVPTNPTTLGKETSIISTTLGGEASTVPTTLAEETMTVPAILQEETLADETPTITTILGEGTPVNLTSC